MQKLPEKLYLASQVREMDRIAIEDLGIPGIALMRKAGFSIFKLIQKHYSEHDMVIFCGAGNNAGDGYVIARLAMESGFKVTVYFVSDPEKLKGDALTVYQDYLKTGGHITAFVSQISLTNSIIVDALLGTGINRDVSGEYASAISFINRSSNPVISVDIPSGLNADTGYVMGCAIKADYTVTFIGLKQGLFTGSAADHCGEIMYDSLDVTDQVFQQLKHTSRLISQCFIPKRKRTAHKGDHGHVLVVGGDSGYSGAIRLAAEAALRVGAGLVSVATHPVHAQSINIGRPELMCYGIEHANECLPLLDKATVIVLGPGLGQDQWGKDLFREIINTNKPIIVDADGLNLLAQTNLKQLNWVLTPHPGEAARLLECATTDIARDRFSCVAKLQSQYGGVALLKGAGTLIKNNSEITLSTTGNPGMASGGMGDTLAGMIGGLVAQNMTLDVAARSAVYIHGKAADLSAQQEGEIGMLASDLLPYIRKLVNK